MTRPGRPIGELRAAVSQLLPERPAWRATELAHALQVPVSSARYTLSRMSAAASVRVVGLVERDGNGRREYLYAAAEQAGLAVWSAGLDD